MADNTVTVSGYSITYTADSSGNVSMRVYSNANGRIVAAGFESDVTTLISKVTRQIQQATNNGTISRSDSIALLNYINSSSANDLNALISEAKAQSAPAQPVPTPVYPPAPNNNTPVTNTSSPTALAGAANDDSGIKQPNTAGTSGTPPSLKTSPSQKTGTPDSGPSAVSGAAPTNNRPENEGQPAPAGTSPASTTGTINAGSKLPNLAFSYRSAQSVKKEDFPGKRINNPLSSLTSYDYQISLYMLTADALDAFITSGRKNINVFTTLSQTATTTNNAPAPGSGGAFLIAQSGGINNKTIPRAPGFEFDYGIDNLVIEQAVTPNETGAATTSAYTMSFTITEPYGFSFISNLKRASDALHAYSNSLSKNAPSNPNRQLYVLGIRFMGYDENGNIATSSSTITNSSVNPSSPNGSATSVESVLSATGTNGSLFEQFYEIILTEVKFKIDGNAVQYHCTATNVSTTSGFGTKYGTTPDHINITRTVVSECLDELMAQCNKAEKDLLDAKKITYPNQYQVVYLGNTADIETAKIKSEADLDKFKYPTSNAKTTQQVNPKKELEHAKPDTTAKVREVGPKIPIIEAISKIVEQSEFMEKALAVVYESTVDNDPSLKDLAAKKNSDQKNVSWFNVSCQITNPKWDPLKSDWSYTLTYIIQPYSTPIANSTFVRQGNYYPGPHKRYNYWFGGKNTEILQFEQTFDTLYYMTGLNPAVWTLNSQPQTVTGPSQPNTTPPNNSSETPTPPNMRSFLDRSGKLGYGTEATASYLTSLYDPGSYMSAEVTIMGDPDYLCGEPNLSVNNVYSKFHHDDSYTINPHGGQVFIEIDFKEAIDYDLDSSLYPNTKGQGIMSINDSILFWKYPDEIAKKIKGVVYMVMKIQHTFRNGKFTQQLSLKGADFGDTQYKDADAKLSEITSDIQSQSGQAITAPNGQTAPKQPDPKAAPPAPSTTAPAPAPPNPNANSEKTT